VDDDEPTAEEQTEEEQEAQRKQIKMGPARPPKGKSGMVFFPDFALREAITAAVYFVILLILAIITVPPLEEVANPQASGYVPSPEWYFLWLFQTLKYFKGNLEPIGTVLIPVIGIGLLMAAPFLDHRQPKTHVMVPGARPVRLWPRIVGAAALILILGITGLAISSKHPITAGESQLTPLQAQGESTFTQMGCSTCHQIGDAGGDRPGAPNLTHFATQPDAQDRVLLHFSGVSQAPGSGMPVYQLSPQQTEALTAYLMSRK
jgi:quinol-cytochrome oxidoreductase complex cytochrome b subunit